MSTNTSSSDVSIINGAVFSSVSVIALITIIYSYRSKYLEEKQKSALSDTDAASAVDAVNATDAAARFVSAPSSVGMFQICWSFYSTAMGAWTLTSPAAYSTFAGYIGLISYSIWAGLPILILVYLSPYVLRNNPNILSLSDFSLCRYGRSVQFFSNIILILILVTNLTVEYTSIGAFYNSVTGEVPLKIIIVTGLLTSFYTMVGGLRASIFTDSIQGITSIILILVIAIYIGSTFVVSPATSELPDYLAANEFGYGSLLVMPVSLTSATIYSEAFWQKIFAGESERAVKTGGFAASIAVTLMVGFMGLIGYLGAINGYSLNDPNLAFFAIFKGDGDNYSAPIGVIALIVVLAAILDEGAVDNAQTGLLTCISTHLHSFRQFNNWIASHGVKYHLGFYRLLIILLNLPPMIIALQNLNVNQLYQPMNLISSSCVIPLLIGAIPLPYIQLYYKSIGFFMGSISGLLSVSIWGYLNQNYDYIAGINYTFFLCFTCWQSYLTAIIASTIGSVISMPMVYVYTKYYHKDCISSINSHHDDDNNNDQVVSAI